MSHFDERSGVVKCATPWGCWWQTNEEVYIEITVEQGTLAKEIKCSFKPRSIHVVIKGNDVLRVSCTRNFPDLASSWICPDQDISVQSFDKKSSKLLEFEFIR